MRESSQDLADIRAFVAGATGVLGRGITEALHERGARVVPGGRDGGRLSHVADRCGTTGVRFDAVDVDSCRAANDSAAKTALATWLRVLRRENRRRFRVVDVRPQHLDTDLDERALGGEPPRLPAPMPASRVVDAVVEALTGTATEVVFDRDAGLVVR